MAEPSRGMGRGLAALLTPSTTTGGAGDRDLRQLPVELIRPNPRQPRREFDEASLLALAGSLGERGLLQPVLVRPSADGAYELIAGEHLERLVGEVEQTQEVRYRDARAADAAADLLARDPQLLDEQRAGARLLDRVEVLARHVLDQRELDRLGVVVGAHERRDGVEPGERGGAPAPLAGDQLVRALGARPHEHRLQQPALAERAGEGEQRRLVELLARLSRVFLFELSTYCPLSNSF